jgi:hypothetical protein
MSEGVAVRLTPRMEYASFMAKIRVGIQRIQSGLKKQAKKSAEEMEWRMCHKLSILEPDHAPGTVKP